MATKIPLRVYNGRSQQMEDIPVFSEQAFREQILAAVRSGARLAALFARETGRGNFKLTALLAQNAGGVLSVLETVVGKTYQSLTPECPQAAVFEREIFEQWGVLPEGHCWLKPLRFHGGYSAGGKAGGCENGPDFPGVMDYYQLAGSEVHEVAVGPVHAGVIEPGHFRFQCLGEEVLHLEISLGYQHRGVERVLPGGPDKRTIHYMETLAGDTTIGHALAYCQLHEALAGCRVPARAQALRAIALELERLANHTGDLGALAADTGYLPAAFFCGRLRGDFLNLTASICGSRFGRNLICPGGTLHDLRADQIENIQRSLAATVKDVKTAVRLLWNTPSVLARLEDTGRLRRKDCEHLGLVGPAARACGLERDVRYEFPAGMYTVTHIPIATWHTGDVFGRAYVRWLEIQRSAAFVQEQLLSLPVGPVRRETKKTNACQMAVSLVEGWRGEICHVAMTDEAGRFSRYKVVDPSLHNWMGLALAMRSQQISDFPLCNKSFNLSYCGHDL
ncbi:NADH-quinone oxidoreductase subunit C [candidate division FCPU426 bacterium]|nr:NADH-quinone oxidoreductase subunit C [candidate division FCPU426 bacterium]